jgi:flavin-dependent dehydrogenase
MLTIWGGPDIVERPALLSSRGADQLLDRGLFDHLLAEAAGARRGQRVAAAEPGSTGWRLVLGSSDATARFVIWATGRQRALLKATGARIQNFDRLVGYLRYVAEPASGDTRTLLEADPDGWWYAAALPGGVRGIAFMTDADLGRSLGLADAAAWQDRLDGTTLIGRNLQWGDLRSEICAAGSSLLDPCCGPNWLAAGDAASVYQPLAAHGITKALRTGCFAAYAAIDVLAGRGEAALARYAGLIRRDFAAYRQSLAGHYAAERRWPDRPFWARRHSAAAA